MPPVHSPRRSPRKACAISIAPKPRHCKRCPGRPLLKECPAHSAQARRQAASGPAPTPSIATNSLTGPVTAQTAQIQDNHVHPGQTSAVDHMSNNGIPPPSRQFVSDQALSETPEDQQDNMANKDCHSPVREFVIDPALLRISEDSQPARTSPSEPQPNQANNQMHSQGVPEPGPDFSTPQNRRTITALNVLTPPDTSFINFSGTSVPFSPSISASPASTPTLRGKNKRIRISGKTQPYGRVEGAMRGVLEYNIPRRRALEKYESSRELRTKAFNERVAGIVRRCEEVSRVSGCWLYFSAQLRTSNHGFVHFASNSLLCDGGEMINDVHSLHSNMYDSLQKATIRDVAQVEMEAAKTRAALNQAKASLHDKDDVIAGLRALLAARGIETAGTTGESSQ